VVLAFCYEGVISTVCWPSCGVGSIDCSIEAFGIANGHGRSNFNGRGVIAGLAVEKVLPLWCGFVGAGVISECNCS